MQHAFIPVWRKRHRTHAISDHTRLSRIWQLARGRRARGVTPRRPWHIRHSVVLLAHTMTIAIPLSIPPNVGGGSRGGKIVEKCSRGDMELKLFLAPLHRARGDTHD